MAHRPYALSLNKQYHGLLMPLNVYSFLLIGRVELWRCRTRGFAYFNHLNYDTKYKLFKEGS